MEIVCHTHPHVWTRGHILRTNQDTACITTHNHQLVASFIMHPITEKCEQNYSHTSGLSCSILLAESRGIKLKIVHMPVLTNAAFKFFSMYF